MNPQLIYAAIFSRPVAFKLAGIKLDSDLGGNCSMHGELQWIRGSWPAVALLMLLERRRGHSNPMPAPTIVESRIRQGSNRAGQTNWPSDRARRCVANPT